MIAGIIAAGLGSRLRRSHPGVLKPLISVAGAPLCHWVAGSLQRAGVADITLLHNSGGRDIPVSLKGAFPEISWRFLRRDTASSWESFRLVSRRLAKNAPSFLISTVDALISAKDISRFIKHASAGSCPAALALTEFVDDEKPLFADINGTGRLRSLGGSSGRYVTAGLYYLTAETARSMPQPSRHAALRDYWISLLHQGLDVRGIPLSKTLDVDRPRDLAAAEGFLKEASWS